MSTVCDDLRAAILQAAMQGKLTKQLPEDGDAIDLLKRITTKRTTKNKATQTITEQDQLFDIPNNWQWIRIGDVFETITGGTPSKTHPEYYGGDYPFFKPSDLGINKYTESASEYLTESGKNTSRQLPENTILVCCIGSIGKTSIMSCEGTTNQQINAILPNDEIDVEYIYYAIKSPVFYDTIWSLASSTTISIVNKSKMDSIMLPIPPLSEQKRIVKKVDELMARVANLEQSADALASLKKAFPDDIKASLLQAAMQGKLTKQLPEDGDAEELLDQIKAEKEKLIAEGKIKKQKPLAPITGDEIPFNIPENWKWTRLSNLFQFINGDRGKNYPSKNKLHASGEIPFISAINMQNGTIREDNLLYADKPTYDKLGSGKLNKDDFVICIRGSLGKYCKYPYELGAIASSLIIARKYSGHILDDYIEAYLQSPLLISEIHDKDNGTAQPNLSAADFMNFLIPIPPLAEQKRIVERLDSLMQNINVVGELIASE